MTGDYGEPAYVKKALEQLQLSADRELRESACLASSAWFWYRPKCLLEVARSPDEEGNRQQARGFLQTDDVNLSGLLRGNPSALFPRGDYITQMLEIYAEDIRPEVRENACRILRNFAPQAATRCL